MQHIGIDGDVNSFLSIADLVIYGSFLEEQSFPAILLQAMCFGKPVIAPDLSMIKKYVGFPNTIFMKSLITCLIKDLLSGVFH